MPVYITNITHDQTVMSVETFMHYYEARVPSFLKYFKLKRQKTRFFIDLHTENMSKIA